MSTVERRRHLQAADILGLTNRQIAEGLQNCSTALVRRFRDREAYALNEVSAETGERPRTRQNRKEEPRVPQEDVAARLAEIPDDTRGLTGRILGDPIPGRRAIDRRNLGA